MSWGLLSRVRHTINPSHPLGIATTTNRSTPFVSPQGEQISSAVGCSWTEFQRAVTLAPGILATNRRSDGGDSSVPRSDRLSDILKVEWLLDGVGRTRPWAGQELSVDAIATNVRGSLQRDPANSIPFRRLLVLVSQGRECSVSLSLTDPDQPSAPEVAVQQLLRAERLPITQLSPNSTRSSSRRAPSFLSDNQPRDRSGRIGEKPKNIKMSLGDPGSSAQRRPTLGRRDVNGDSGHENYVLVEDDEFGGEETPRIKKGVWAGIMQQNCFDEERERERGGGFLESLRQVYFHFSVVVLHG